MPTIFDIVNANEIADFYTEPAGNQIPYLGEVLWPNDRNVGLELAWIKSSGGLPVALRASAFDANAVVRDRIGFNKMQTEMPFFRESMRIGEKERQKLLQALQTNNAAYYQPLINRIYDDAKALLDGAKVVPERMRMQLLASGKISIYDAETRQDLEYDYGLSPDQQVTLSGTSAWSDPDAQIIANIRTGQNYIQDNTGEKPSRAICTLKTWTYMLQNSEIRRFIQPLANPAAEINDAALRNFLLTQLGITVQVYDKPYETLKPDGTREKHKFFPDDVFTLLPAGTLGKTYYGTTPEEADLQGGANPQAQVQIVDGGVALVTKAEYGPPVNVQTIVSEIVLPSFEAADKIYIMNVA